MKTLLISLLLATNAYAIDLNINEFNINYKKPKGNLNVSEVIYDSLKVNPTSIDFSYEDNILTIENGPTVIEYKTSEFTNVQGLNLESFSITASSKNDIKLTARNFRLDSEKTNFGLNSASILCKNESELTEISDALNSCFSSSKIRLNHFDMDSTNIDILNILANVLPEFSSDAGLVVKSFSLNTNSNNFSGKATVKYGINLTLKIGGKIHYLNEEEMIRVKLEKAKVGFISIRGKIFDELKKKQSDKLIVEKPFIYIKL